PRNVTTCRCGATLPAESAPLVVASESESESSSGALPKVLMGVIVFGALAGVAYWTFMQPAPPSSLGLPRNTAAAPDVSAPADARTASAQARAWDAAAANAKDAPVPASPEPSAPSSASDFPAPSKTPAASIEEMVD